MNDAIDVIQSPASVGWRTRVGDTEVEVAWPRGTRALMLGLRHAPDGPWRGMITLDRRHWGHNGTEAGAEARAVQFLEDLLEEESLAVPA